MNAQASFNIFLGIFLLGVAICAMVLLVNWWRGSLHQTPKESDDPLEQLSQFTAARDAGRMSEEEYQQVRDVMIRKARAAGLLGSEPKTDKAPRKPAKINFDLAKTAMDDVDLEGDLHQTATYDTRTEIDTITLMSPTPTLSDTKTDG